VLTIPNLLCISRIVVSPFLGYLILQSDFLMALGVFVFAGISDLVSSYMGAAISIQYTSQPVYFRSI